MRTRQLEPDVISYNCVTSGAAPNRGAARGNLLSSKTSLGDVPGLPNETPGEAWPLYY